MTILVILYHSQSMFFLFFLVFLYYQYLLSSYAGHAPSDFPNKALGYRHKSYR